ncbi:hypothetical protein [Kocuria palustris]|uniref:hypothetical protein n=1 Tax=Kocuria palustris TaxID=71999 RepID=UPI0011AA86EB|nr:hypothetical protein [Kocuria palustris]
MPATVPGTVASALRDARLEPDPDPDARDWWWTAEIDLPPAPPGASGPGPATWELRLRGVATVSEIWWDGMRIATSSTGLDDVAARFEADAGRHGIAVVCRALSLLPVPRRPRPRWRSSLVGDQSLRWRRTPLMGRIHWGGTEPAVGPWGEADLRRVPDHGATVVGIRTGLDADLCTAHVVVTLEAVRPVTVELACAGSSESLDVPAGRSELRLGVTRPPLWWPATHGDPVLHRLSIRAGAENGPLESLAEASVGFRRIVGQTDGGGFRLFVNGQRIFARGAVWAPVDPLSLGGEAAEIERTVRAMRSAGANILRISGTGAWESAAFYGACDRLGVMVWQDAMLATLDPPETPEWLGQLEAEMRTWLPRLGAHPCLAVLSGGNEVLQQPVLWGRPPQDMAIPAIDELIPRLCAELVPGVVHVATSPCGGTPPTRPDQGISHWFGVGAYRRPLSDARLSGVRFAAEALAFGCPPAPSSAEEAFGTKTADQDHDARSAWRAAAARDPGASWDFEEISAHYARRWIAPGIDADRGATGAAPGGRAEADWDELTRTEQLRLERAAAARAVERTLVDLRRPGSQCDGVIVLAARDLLPGAGWGLLDSEGRPKATWYAMRRACAPVAVAITDEGLSGLHVHVLCDRPIRLRAVLRLSVWTTVGVRSHERDVDVRLDGPGAVTFGAESELGGFMDLDRSWGFGDRQWEALAAKLLVADDSDDVPEGSVLETVRLLGDTSRDALADLRAAPSADAPPAGSSHAPDGSGRGYRAEGRALVLRAEAASSSVCVPSGPGLIPEDDGFDLAPGTSRRVEMIEEDRWPPTATTGPADRVG